MPTSSPTCWTGGSGSNRYATRSLPSTALYNRAHARLTAARTSQEQPSMGSALQQRDDMREVPSKVGI